MPCSHRPGATLPCVPPLEGSGCGTIVVLWSTDASKTQFPSDPFGWWASNTSLHSEAWLHWDATSLRAQTNSIMHVLLTPSSYLPLTLLIPRSFHLLEMLSSIRLWISPKEQTIKLNTTINTHEAPALQIISWRWKMIDWIRTIFMDSVQLNYFMMKWMNMHDTILD